MFRGLLSRVRLVAPAGALLALCSCAQILGIDELSPGGRDGAPPDDRPDARPLDAAPPDASVDTSCREAVASDGTGATVIDTEAAGNDFSATCGGESSPDQMLVWTAPVTDYYVFDTFGSGFDTVLALFDECAGQELACSNNVGEIGQSELVRKLEAGRPALVLVDGAAGDSGQGTLNIQRVACPDADLEGQVFPVELTTRGFGDDFASLCGGLEREDRAYHWVAPQDGLYQFRATSDSFRPVVTLLDGPRCSDRILGCNAAQSGPRGAEVVRFVRAGQPVSVIVDGIDGSGLFTLDIARRPDQTCPEAVLVALSEPLNDDFTGRTLAPSCGFAQQDASFGGVYDVPDRVYSFTVPSAGGCFGSCGVTVDAPQSVVLYTLEGGQCAGAELQCEVAELDTTSGRARATVFFEYGAMETTYTIVVADRSELDGGGFTLTSECFLACP